MSRFVGFSYGRHLSLYQIDRDAPMPYVEIQYVPQLLRRGDLNVPTPYVERQYPLEWRNVRLLGSFRSTVCIYNVPTREVALWDPFAANGHRLLPAADNRPLEWGLSFDGFNSDRQQVSSLGLVTSVYVFGFDERNAEYVLLRVVQTESRATSNFATVSIYREGDNMWTLLDLQGRPYFLPEPCRGVFLRDRLYWLMRRGRERDSAIVLVAFDISTDSFVDVDLPNNIDNVRRMDLARLGGHLCLIIYRPQSPVDVRIKRYNGSEQPWEQLFSLNDHNFNYVQPLAYFQDDLNRVWVELSRNRDGRNRDGDGNKTLGCYNLLTKQLRLNAMSSWSFVEATYLSLRF